jgi:uroporphyrinogen decarboxylase
MSWTPRERVLAAINHEEADRVAIDLGGTFASSINIDAYENLKRHLGLDYQTRIMSTLHQLAFPDAAVLESFGVDTRPIVSGGGVTLQLGDDRSGDPRSQTGRARWVDDVTFIDDFGVTLKCTVGTDDKHFLAKDGPFWGGKLTRDRIDAFDWPDPDAPGVARGVKEQVEHYKASGDYCLILNVPGQVIHRGYSMRGMEDFLKDLYRAPEAVCYLMDRLADHTVRVGENMIDAAGAENIDIIFFGEDLGTQDGCMFDPEGIYARYIKPRHERIIQTLKSKAEAKSLFHCCGSAYHFIDHLIDIGVDALNPVQVTAKNMEPDRLKGEFGDRMAFWGGINSQEILPYGSADDVRAETERCIDIFGRQGGYVVNSVHNIQAEVPPENVVAMFEQARQYRPSRGRQAG